MEEQSSNYEAKDSGLDIIELISPYIEKWKLITILTLTFLMIGFLYARYKVPVYEANAKILVNTDKKGSSKISELAAFNDLDIFNEGGGTVQDQMEILKSRRLIHQVVEEHNFNVKYKTVGSKTGLTKRTIFGEYLPFKVEFINRNDFINLTIDVIDTNLYRITSINDNNVDVDVRAGKIEYLDSIGIKISSVALNLLSGTSYEIRHTPIDFATDEFLDKLHTETIDRKSNTILLKIRDESPDRAVLFLNELLKYYNKDAVTDKNKVAANTVSFINERMRLISNELSVVEDDAEQFKYQRGLVDIPSESKIYLEDESYNAKLMVEVGTQVELSQFVLDYLNQDTTEFQLLPANLGLKDRSVNNIIEYYNKMILERERIMDFSSDQHPKIINMTNQIQKIRLSLNKSLEKSLEVNKIELKSIERKLSSINSRIAQIPEFERTYREIMRQQKIKEALYIYLLEKREEAVLRDFIVT